MDLHMRRVRSGDRYGTSTAIHRCAILGALALILLIVGSLRLSAQTGGPVQSEYSGGPVSPGPNVDQFTGRFSYGLPLLSVPGPHGSGYTISLSYLSGTNPNDVAPWVGYGWSLNAGAIVRETRGFPDDWEDTVIYWNKVPKNYTVTGTPRIRVEASSRELIDSVLIGGGIGYEYTNVFNNFKGQARRYGYNVSLMGIGSLQYEWGDDAGGFSYHIDPHFASKIGEVFDKDAANGLTLNLIGRLGAEIGNRVGYSFGDRIRPMDLAPYEGTSWNYATGLHISIPPIHVGIKGGVNGRVTEQISDAKRAVPTYGYLYSHDAIFTDQTFLDRWLSIDGEVGARGNMDYYREMTVPYRQSNVYLPIPFSSADNFALTGGAGGGGMRLFSNTAGHFFPHTTKSTTDNIQIGVDLTGGGRWGLGGKFGGGASISKVTGWWYDGMGYTNAFPVGDASNQAYFLRFTNDLGGTVLFSASDDAVRAGLLESVNPTLATASPLSSFINPIEADISDDISPEPLQLGESRRDLFSDFHTIAEWKSTTDQGKFYKSYNKRIDIRSFVDLYDPRIQKSIGEVAVTGADGSRRVYGLPVFARREKNIRYGLDPDAVGLPTTTIDHNLLASSQIASTNAPTVMGEERNAPYVAAYLLTEITTPDYIDVDFNGPSADDIGGWTKFNYVRTAGSNTKSSKSGAGDTAWYSWRYPLNGLLYDKGSLSDGRDNLGAFSSGQRELYYLESIETKTHIAIFVTNKTDKTWGSRHIQGSGTWRDDGQMAVDVGDLQESAQEKEAAGATEQEPVEGRVRRYNVLCQLERIELYTKDENGDPDSLLTTVYLEYDHSLRKDLPNSAGVDSNGLRNGMLTLKKVWIQPQGLAPARIQPYEFGYEYRTSADYPLSARLRYPDATSYADSLSASEQNPNYSFFQLDRWGSYRADGEERAEHLNPWVDQSPDPYSFDPAAWQLKWIRMPSGGETHIQYEQNEYSYVQDRQAMAMASLLDSINSNGTWYKASDQNTSNSYFLDLDDLGIDDTDKVTLDELVATIQHRYVANKKNKMFFKFLYALKGTTAGIENSERTSEYITGYVSVYDVALWQLTFGSPPYHYGIEVKLKSDGGDGPVPRRICHEYVRHNRWGLLDPGDMIADRAPAQMIYDVIGKFGWSTFDADSYCNDIDYPNSYLRVPMVTPKKGGGIRVRRLLTLDPGNEGDSALYGTEYLYEIYDEERRETIGSGVATNEPSLGREENALVDFHSLPERPELDDRSIYGDDKDRYESPLGESILPSASVGYSRVVARSIHTGKTNPGFAVGEFFTTRDYPFDKPYDQGRNGADYIGINSYSVTAPPNTNGANESTGGGFATGVIFSSDKTYLTQGYRFILNSMNGQPKRSTSYGGRYDDPASWYTSASTRYTYYEPGDSIPMMKKVGEAVYYDNPGKEMDVAMESRATLENIMGLDVQADVTGLFVDIQFGASAEGVLSNSELYTHVTNKVIHYPAYVKSVLSYGDGVYSLSENVAFSPETGAPIVTKTYDSHNGLTLAGTTQVGAYHNYVFPASTEYPELGQKAANGRALLQGTGSSTIKVYYDTPDYLKFAGPSACEFVNTLTPGDLVMLRKKSDGSLAGFFHVGGTERDSVWLIPVASAFATEIVGTIDEVDVEVLESGRRNQMAASVGSITTYGESTSDVLAGTNVAEWTPAGTTERQGLAALLNAALQAGGGLIDPAAVDSLGVQFIDPETSECDSLRETLRLELKDDGLTVTRGTFSVTDTVCGSPSTPHPMVDWLNDYLDAIWGYEVPASHESGLTVCNNPDLWRHAYTEPPQEYIDLQDGYLDHEFDCVDGYKVPRNIDGYIQRGIDDDLNAGFRTDSTSLFKATGPFHLVGVTTTDFLEVSAVGDCSGGISQMRMRRQWLFGANSKDSTSYYNTPDSADFAEIYPYTTRLGRFEEDSSGYLTYHDLYRNNTPYRAFGIRFHKLDTIPQDVVCQERYPTSGGVGAFSVDRYGRLVYTCGDGTCPPSVVSCLDFCPDSELRAQDTLHGVVAASAAILDDHDPYRTEDWTIGITGLNDYERGLRGKWRPRTSFIYRTPTTGGADVSLGERNYKKAGVYTGFTVFDWQNQAANDRTHWVRLDTVTRYSPYGQAVETRDRLGIYSSIKYDARGMLPRLVAANADYGSVGFKDFEADPTSPSAFAHSGSYSLLMTSGSDDFSIGTQLTDRLRDKGALIRFWGKGIGTGSNLQIHVAPATQPLQNVDVGVTRIAQTGEWTLYEATVTDFSGMTPTGDDLLLTFLNSAGDTIYIDDVRMQPTDAEMVCYSYDGRTMRPLVTFDAQHFGTYVQYNAQGTPVRSIVETVRGYKTVADAYGHIPSQPRTGEGSRAHPGGDVPTRLRAGSVGPRVDGVRSGPGGATFDLLNVELGADRQEVKTLGGEAKSIPEVVAPSVPSLDRLSLPDVEYVAMVRELDSLDRQITALQPSSHDTLSRAERLRIAREVRRLSAQRQAILRRYGIDESSLEELRRRLRDAGMDTETGGAVNSNEERREEQ